MASQAALGVKNPPANARDIRNMGCIPGLGRSPGGGNGNQLRYSCLENPMDRGAWGAKVHGITKGQTQLKQFSMYACPTETGNTADSQIFILNFGLQFTTTLFSCSNFCPHFCSLGVLSIGVYDLFDSVWNVWVLVHFLTFWHCKMS